jgi:hypothetical protein
MHREILDVDDPNQNTSLYDTPSFLTLYYDNIKTTGYFGGLATGAIPFGATFGATTLGTAPLLVILAGDQVDLKYWPGTWVATIVGGTAAIAGGFVSSVFIAPFFTIAAHFRKFKSNNEIRPDVKRLLKFTDTLTKQNIINEIIKNPMRGSVRSFESHALISNLESENLTLNQKWKYLTEYMNAQSKGAYIHNGKNLFNKILEISHQFIHQIKLQ